MDDKKKLVMIIPIILVLLIPLILTFFIDFFYDVDEIKSNLIWIIPIVLAVTLATMIFSFIWSFKDFRNLFKKIDRKTWIALLLIFLVGFSLRVFVAPQVHRLYYDEDIYLDIGYNIAKNGKASYCTYGNQEACYEAFYMKQPNGYPFLMSGVFLFGGDESTAHCATAIISSLTIISIFFISYLLFKNKKISLFSTLIFSLVPVAIRWAPTTTSDTVFIFFTSLTVLGFLSYFKSDKTSILMFSFFSLAYAIQMRPEGLLLIILIIFMFLLIKKNLLQSILKVDFLLILLVFSILIVPHLIHSNSVKDENWGTEGDKLGTEYIFDNFEDNGIFFFDNVRFPVFFTILAFLGLAYDKMWKKKLFLASWFLIFFGLYLLFYAGSFDYGVDVRFSLTMYVPIAILGGCGAFLISKNINKVLKIFFDKKWISHIGLIAATVCVVSSFIPFIGFVSSTGERAWDARLCHDFLVEKLNELDDNCLIITMIPSVVEINGKNFMHTEFVADQSLMNRLLTENNCVFYYEDYWTYVQFNQTYGKYIHDNYKLTIYDSVRVKGTEYTLYYISLQ